MARKSFMELDPTLSTRLIEALSTGVSIHDACAYVGISQATYFYWCRRGQKAKADNATEAIYLKFFNDTTHARVSGRIGAAAVIRQAALGNPKTGVKPDPNVAMWYLERTDPSTWGRKDMLIALGLDGKQLRELKAKADSAGVDLSLIFEQMLNELGQASVSAADRESES